MSNGGQVGSRGYIFQSIVALMECLERYDWDEIKVEPITEQDKVDIQLYSNGEILSAIQVKSSANAFKRSDAQKYLDAAKNDSPDAKEVYLYLITDKYTESIKQYAHNEPDVKEYPFEHLEDVCKGKLLDYVDRAGLSQEITVSNLILIYKNLFATVILNSKATKPIHRTEFEAEFQRAIPVSKADMSHVDIPQRLTPIPLIERTVGLVGRDAFMDTVKEMLEKNSCIVLVNGLGGIGKTAVMQGICNDLMNEGKYVAWINCGESLREDLLMLRDSLGIPISDDVEAAFRKVKEGIKSPSLGKNLYIFLDDLVRKVTSKELSELNELGAHVMITSRREDVHLPKLKLKGLKQQAAIDMFFGYYAPDDLEQMKEKKSKYYKTAWDIIKSVNSHTLLVELIAKAAWKKGGTLDAFRKKMEAEGVFDVFRGGIYTEHDDENLTIVESVKRLYEMSELTEEQQHIMKLFTLFTPEKEIYYKVAEWADFNIDELDGLIELGWLVRGGLENGFQIHQIVKDSLSKQVGEVRLEEYGELLDNVIATYNYLGENVTYEFVRERIVLTEDIAGCLWKAYQADSRKDEAWAFNAGGLINNLGGIYYAQGDYEKALEYCEKAIVILEQVLGNEDLSMARMHNNIANIYTTQGDYGKALECFRKALVICERVLGAEHPETATTYNNIASMYGDQGDYGKALEYYRKALVIYERVLGAEHPKTAKTYSNMATVYDDQDDYKKALEFSEKALNVLECMLGTEHPDTACTYNNIAVVYENQGDYGKALEYHRKALAIRERVLGTDHLDTAWTYNNLAVVYGNQGDYGKALEYLRKALVIYERVLGTEHPDTAWTYSNMASVYENQGDYGKALDYYQRSLKIYLDTFGGEHPRTKIILENLTDIQTKINE